MVASQTGRPGAQVDVLIDEKGSPIDVPDNSSIRAATEAEQTVGATGPTNWWRIGLLALALIALALLILQFVGGGGPATTDVVPGTPVTAPEGTQ